MQFGGRETEAGYVPNIRERLICPVTNLNNRQRLVADLVAMRLSERTDSENVYVMEQVTPFYKWLTARHGRHNIVGSEYLGDDLAKGAIINEVRHEDIQALSFEDNSIDFVISNEVMEHVPSPAHAFSEVARVMRPGAEAIMTFPFFVDRPQSLCRAELRNGKIVHHHEPQYHGNPISPDGSLVFNDFGWDIFEVIRNAGFADVVIEIYHSAILGHLGSGLLVFRMTK